MIKSMCRVLWIFCAVCAFVSLNITFADVSQAAAYRKATEGKEVVLNKLYPKKKKFELAGDFGQILNQSYISSWLMHFGGTYYASEEWGYGADFGIALNSDKGERTCIETFYNDPNHAGIPVCGAQGDPNSDFVGSDGKPNGANYGPAYVPITELKYLITGMAYWNPIYGKQLLARSATNHFDIFLAFGGGVAMLNFYPQEEVLKNGKPSRGTFDKNNPSADPGARLDEDYAYGTEGRPEPVAKTSPVIAGAIGQKYHFAKRFVLRVELKNYILLATEQGFETFFTLWGGIGVRL